VHDFALLAPVPLRHLQSGLEVATSGYVAFGTMKWELLRKLDVMRKGAPVPALIYPSHEDVHAKLTFLVCWYAWYVGHVHSSHGKHPLGMKHRPETTAHDRGHWAAFWHVKGLRELPTEKHLPISEIGAIRGGWRKNAPPRGPELVQLPELLSHED
jgi:hypothetical protein